MKGPRIAFVYSVLLGLSASCSSTYIAKSVMLACDSEMPTTRRQLEAKLGHSFRWQCSSFVGAVQLEEYHFADGSSLGVNAVPAKLLERSPEDRVVKLQAYR